MIIWVLTNEYEGNIIGGLGTVATLLSKTLAKYHDMELTVICKSSKKRIETNTSDSLLRVIRFPYIPKYYSHSEKAYKPAAIYRTLIARGHKKPDAIHIHSLQYRRLALYCKRRFNTPIFYTCHSLTIMEKGHRSRLKSASPQIQLMRKADTVTVPSRWLKRQIKRYYPSYNKPVQVIPNGIHMRRINRSRQSDAHHLLYVGRLIPMKGIEQLLGAVSILKKNKPWVRLTVAGSGSSSYTKILKYQAKKLKIYSNVRWLGRVKPQRLQRLYGSCGLVIVPSKQESFGLVALEAMASGIPLVATRKGGLASFVNPSNATLIPRVYPKQIAGSIRRLWNSPNETEQKRRKAKETAASYSWSRISAIYHDLFTLKAHSTGLISRDNFVGPLHGLPRIP